MEEAQNRQMEAMMMQQAAMQAQGAAPAGAPI
jgi:hypothetical protein